MAYEFKLPDIGEGVAEGEIVQWFVTEGGTVKEDAPLVSVLTDKANVEIPSPKSGADREIHAQVGEKVKVGGVLVTIEESGGGSAPGPASKQATPRRRRALRLRRAHPLRLRRPLRAVSPPTPPKPAAPPAAVATGATGGGSPLKALATPYSPAAGGRAGDRYRPSSWNRSGGRILESDLAGKAAAAPGGPTSSAPPPGSCPTACTLRKSPSQRVIRARSNTFRIVGSGE